MRLKAVTQKTDAASYTAQIEELTQKLAAQYMREGIPADNATKLANSCGIDALVKGARNPQTRLILRACEFETLSKASTKMLKEDAAPGEVAQILALNSHQNQRGGRGNGRDYGNYCPNHSGQ